MAERYLPELDAPEGLYLEEIAVSTHDDICHALAINTNDR